MFPFPNEGERSAEVQTVLAQQFELAEAMYNVWLTHDKDRWYAKSKHPRQILVAAMMLDVQACRQFRSIVEECRRGEGFNASIICRSLYETVLAQMFVLAKRVRIIVAQRVDKKTKVPIVDSAGNPVFGARPASKAAMPKQPRRLTRKLRALLFLAYMHLGKEEAVDRLAKIPGLKRRAEMLKRRRDPATVTYFKKRIGPAWTSVLAQHPHTYSGLSIANLAKVLHRKMYSWYEVIYHFQSGMAHGTDATRHVDMDENSINAVYVSSVSDVYQALRAAMMLMLVSMLMYQLNIGFGQDIDWAYTSLKRQFTAYRQTFG